MMVTIEKTTAETNGASRRDRRRLETQQRLIEAAFELISAKGLFEVTVEEITERADVGKGTFFNYFPTKEHLLATLFAAKREEVAQTAEMMRSADEIKPLLKQFVMMIIRQPKRTPAMVQSIFSSALMNPAVQKPFCSLIDEGRNTIAVALERGQVSGEVRKDIDALDTAKFFQQVLFGTQAVWALHNSHSDLEEQISLAFEIFWRGIAAQPEAATGRRRRSKK